MIELTERNGSVTFSVRVAPRASRNSIDGDHGGALKIRLTVPPVDGRANAALCRILADCLNVPIAAVKIVAGETSRSKRVSIAGISKQQILNLLSKS
jgi:uncharacterized protein